jgi:putative NADH-flavin reductase
MKLLLLGASGRTGKLVLDYALSKGHDVVALVRDPSKLPSKRAGLTVMEGSPEKFADVVQAAAGCEAVVVALNNNRTSDMPWAKPLSPPHLMEASVKNVIEALKLDGMRRLVVLSATGVGDSFPYAPWLIRFMVKRTNLGVTYADHDAVDAFLRATPDIDWTLVRAVGLTNADKVKDRLIVSYGGNPKPALTISRKHVAKFMIDCLADTSFFQKAPVVSER